MSFGSYHPLLSFSAETFEKGSTGWVHTVVVWQAGSGSRSYINGILAEEPPARLRHRDPAMREYLEGCR